MVEVRADVPVAAHLAEAGEDATRSFDLDVTRMRSDLEDVYQSIGRDEVS